VYRISIRFVESAVTTTGSATGARRRLSAAERRERILAAATEVFAERGYGDASVGEIAGRAGVVASVIYDHFRSKRDLHIQLLELHGSWLIENSITAIGVGEPREMLRESVDALYRLIEQDPFAWRFIFRDPPADAEIAAAWRSIHDQATAGIAALIEAGAPGAAWIEGVDRATAAWMLAKASQGATNRLAEWWFEHREVPREKVTDFAVRLLWDGYSGLLAEALAGGGSD
jgi:AcrR family transcriptional regulator